ncbi:MAG: hypothetical protein VX741_12190, partial [Pseudomonadota bacterium]|nr:hypothetical protein [Pseudomonadota bacterium]
DSRVRVTAQLINAEFDHHIWAERYDRELEDIFEVQDDVTRRIVATLSPELARSEQKRSARSQPQDLKAWDYLQRGAFYSYQFSKEGSELGREMFQKALDIDPSYARAFAEIAFSHAVDLGLGHAASGGDTMSELSKAAREAVRLDPSDSMAQLMLSFAYAWTDQYDLSISTVERAIDLNPSYARALGHLGTMLDLTGRHDAGITGLRDSLRLNPNKPFISQWHLTFLARALVVVRRYEEAVEAARKAISVRATHLPAHYILAVALGHLDRQSEAQAALAQCEREQPGFVQERTEWRPYRDEARNDHIFEGLRKAGWTG